MEKCVCNYIVKLLRGLYPLSDYLALRVLLHLGLVYTLRNFGVPLAYMCLLKLDRHRQYLKRRINNGATTKRHRYQKGENEYTEPFTIPRPRLPRRRLLQHFQTRPIQL